MDKLIKFPLYNKRNVWLPITMIDDLYDKAFFQLNQNQCLRLAIRTSLMLEFFESDAVWKQ